MSEYQYYEFLAVDRPLNDAARRELRALSTRARITATSFTNTYQWGDFKGDPQTLMERWFDLHVYVTNWRTRRLMIRVPKQSLDRRRLAPFLANVDCVGLKVAGQNLIIDIHLDEVDTDDDDDGTGWLAMLAPLRAALLVGDLRLFYLLWLTGIETEATEAEQPEPMSGIGPLTGALDAFGEFLDLDPDLVRAAAERPADNSPSAGEVRKIISALPDRDKVQMLARLFEGDPQVAMELRTAVRDRLSPNAMSSAARTIGELLARARAIRLEREREAAGQAAAERKRQEAAARKAQRARLDALMRRGDVVWDEVEAEIERRNAAGYDRATSVIVDLKTLAAERGTLGDFRQRLAAIRERHARKLGFMQRIGGL